MKYKDCLLWLLLPLAAIVATDAKAGMVLNPSAGLSRITYFGSLPDGPPGIVGYDYTSTTNGSILGDYDARGTDGMNYDSLLLYDLRGLSGVPPAAATLTMRLDSVLQNFDPSFSWYTDLYITLSGSKASTLGPEGFGATSAFETVISIPTGNYGGSSDLTLNLTAAISGLVAQGFDYATLLFQTFDSTVAGPSLVTFTQSPTLDLTSSSGTTASVPEPSSIVLFGIPAAGLLLRNLIGRRRM